MPTDFDNRRDLDLLSAGGRRAARLWRNLRDGTFRDVAAEVGLGAAAARGHVGRGDVNKDGFTDFFFGARGGPDLLALSDGRGRFTVAPAPGGVARAARRALFLDYDNDGLLDLLAARPEGRARSSATSGTRWIDATATRLARRAARERGRARSRQATSTGTATPMS